MAREMQLPNELQPEQFEVLKIATMPNTNQFIFVQGVAGSGKTTIALHVARKAGELNTNRSSIDRQTILFLTYNDRLAEYCRNTLLLIPTVAEMIAPDRSKLYQGQINVMTVNDLFRLAISLNTKNRFLSDEECINYIAKIAGQRGILDLLPSQVFSLISTFLRGRPELSNKSIDDLNAIIDQDRNKSAHYRMYGDSLQNIRRRLLSTYEDWKRSAKGLDRSDVAKQLREQLLELESYLSAIPNFQAERLRESSRRKLGDSDPKTEKVLCWVDEYFSSISDIPDFEQKSKRYHSILNSGSINQIQLNELRNDLYSYISQSGLRATSLWEPLCSYLQNPIIIVDEVQDLSSIECENLISLWFHLLRNRESHFFLLGDFNQQITPSGFEWSTLYELVVQKAKLYQQPVQEREEHFLTNNYRTTDEIADFVYNVMKNVVPKALADQDYAQRFLEFSIDPRKTLAINLVEKILQIKEEGGELIPHVLVGTPELFTQGLEKYVETLKCQKDLPAEDDKRFSTVIITEHGSDIGDLISKESAKYVLDNDLIEVIPVLSCKGLEFDRCVLHGLSIKNNGEIEQDLVSRWYTSFTRAKLQLLIYLTNQEFDFIESLGWDQIPVDVVRMIRVSSADEIAAELQRLGKTDIDDDARYSISEANLARFLLTGNENYLQKSLRSLSLGNLQEKYRQTAYDGANWFERQSNYLKAADYYHEAEYFVDEVRCLAILYSQSTMEGSETSEVREYQNRAHRIAQSAKHYETQARCWLLLQEYENAITAAKKSKNTNLQQIIAAEIAEQVRVLATTKRGDAMAYAELLEENEHLEAAALSWLSLSTWDRAFQCASSLEKSKSDNIAKQAEKLAFDFTKKRSNEAILIAGKLDEYKYYDLAAHIWQQLRKIPQAIQSLVYSREIEQAEKLLKNPEYRTSEEEKRQSYIILAKGYRKNQIDWKNAYKYYHFAGSDDECKRIELECKNLLDYRTLVSCYDQIGDHKNIIALANELELRNDNNKELIAECWEITEEWERAANAWMKLFDEHNQRSVELFGPRPIPNLLPDESSTKRFQNNIEKNLHEYQLALTEWEQLSKYESNPQRLIDNYSKVVQIISSSELWQSETTSFLKLLRERSRYAVNESIQIPSKSRLPEKIKNISASDIVDYWSKFDVVNAVFQQRAVLISQICYHKSKSLLAIQLMYKVCRKRDSAIKMSDELFRTDMELWIKSWKTLEYSTDEVEQKIFSSEFLYKPEVVRRAINETYQSKTALKQILWDKYRELLVKNGSRRAQDILKQYFPEYQQLNKVVISSSPTNEPQISDLIKEISSSLGSLSSDEVDRMELEDHLSAMLGMIDQKERLARRWKTAKSLMPEDIEEFIRTRIAQLDKLIEETPKTPQSGLSSKNGKDIPINSIVNEPTKTKPGRRPRHRTKQVGVQRELRVLDVHTDGSDSYFDLNDFQKEFEAKLVECIDDNSVGALLINHGIGKDKSHPVIKEWLHQRTKKLMYHRRVKRIVKGEEIINAFDKTATMIRKSVDNLDFSKIGVNNPGVTVILFDRN